MAIVGVLKDRSFFFFFFGGGGGDVTSGEEF